MNWLIVAALLYNIPIIHGCFTYIFHHITAFTFSFTEFPVQPQLMREEKTQTQWLSISHTLKQTQRHTQTHTKENLSEISPSVSGEFGCGTVWSRRGQTVARHPEELPLCLCTATSCNLLLRDKTKLTRHFTADLTVLSDLLHQIWLCSEGLVRQVRVYKTD